MNVEITGRHVVITPAIRTYILKRLRKFAKIFGDDISFHVIIGVQKERQTAEILLKSKLLDLNFILYTSCTENIISLFSFLAFSIILLSISPP